MGSCHLPLQEIRELIAAGDKLHTFLARVLCHPGLRPGLEDLFSPGPSLEWVETQTGRWVGAKMNLRNSMNV